MTNEELVKLIQSGQNVRENMEKLYNDNLSLIRKIAHKYHAFASMDDLTQQGYLALVDACKQYDSTRGALFSTYFTIVFQHNINAYLALTGQCVRVPLDVRHELMVYHRLLGKGLSLGEIAEEMEISLKKVQKLASLDEGAISLYAPVGENEDSQLLDMIAAPEQEDQPDLSEVWECVENCLKDKHARIIYDLYHEGVSVCEEAERMGMSHQGIQHHEEKALFRLRQIRKIRNLAEMADIDIYGRCGVGYFKATHTSSTEYAVIQRDRIKREEERCHNEWLSEFEQKKSAFYEQYGIKQ